jgi:hypothetical protein
MGIIILLVAVGAIVVLIGVLGCAKALITAKKYFLSWKNDI